MPDTQPYDYILAGGTVIDGSNTPASGRRGRARRPRGRRGRPERRGRARRRVRPGGRARLHRLAHARRQLPAAPARHDAQDLAGRDHRDHRQLRHQPGAAGASRAAGAAGPAGRGRLVQFTRFADYLDALRATPAAVNAACMVGHSTLRAAVMPDLHRPATPAEIDAMRALAEEAMASGAIGVSTGTFTRPPPTPPPRRSSRSAGRWPRTAASTPPMRDEGEHIVPALEETFRIGRELDVPW